MSEVSGKVKPGTYCEEEPLEHFAVVVRIIDRVKPVNEVLVIVLGEIEQNSRGLEDTEIIAGVVDEHGNATVRVQLDEPWLLLNISRNVDLRKAGDFVRSAGESG